MKNVPSTLSVVLSAMALIVVLTLAGMPATAQSSTTHDSASAQQAPSQPSGDQSSASEQKTFTGKIVKTGDKLVLTDSENKTTYQLDDQQKAGEYVNKTVKVTGVLDATTGTIRVSAIDPA